MIEASSFKNTKVHNFCGKLINSINVSHLLEIFNLIFQCLLSFLAVTIYIVDTYYPEIGPDSTPEDISIKNNLSWTELSVAIVITISYIISFALSSKKLKFLLNIYNILDLVTAIPSFFMFLDGVGVNLGFARIFRLLRLIRIIRVFKVFQTKERNEDGQEKSNDEGEFRKKMLSSLFTILCIVFLSTGIVHFLDHNFLVILK